MKFFKVKKANNAGYKIIEYGFKVSEKTFPNDYVFESHSESGSKELNKIFNSEQEILDLVEKRYNLTNIDWNKETYSNDEFIFYSSIFDVVAKHRQNSFGNDYLKTNDSRLPKYNFNPSNETFKAELRVIIKHLGKEIQSAITQPNKPKPTTMLPQNMEWSWDPEAVDWVAVMKDNTNVTPPLYNPQNQNVVNQNTTSYMNMVKSSNNYTDENTPEYESRVCEAYKQLAGMIEEIDILKDYAKRSGDLRLFDAYLQLGREVANEWDVKPEAVFGEMVLSSPELPQKLADIDKENFNKENEEWLKKHKNASKKVPSSKKELNILLKLLDKCWYGSGKGRYADIGNWSIGLGGYDTGYEVSYNGTPIFSITEDNELKPYMSDDRLQKDFGFSYSDVEKALKKHRDLENLKMIKASQKDIEEVADSIINTYSGEEELEVLKEYSRKMRKEPIGVFNVMVDNAARRWGLNPNELMGCIMKKDRALVKQIVNLTIEENKKDLDDSVKKLSSKKVKSAKMKSEKFDGSAFEELKHNAKLCGDEIWSSVNGSLIKVLAYFPIENGKYNVLYEKITDMFNGIGYVSDIKVNKDENFKFYKECEPATIDFSSLELLPGDDTYEQIGFVRNSSVKCLSEFLDGPRYSKEIKIEAGLIKDGLVKYAGFDFNRGTKYAITEKGLKILRSAAEKEHNEALNEREKLAYMFGFNTDKETTLDTTGKTIKADDKDIIVIDTGSGYLQVFENDDTYDYGGYSVGEQLYEFSINDEDRRNGKATLDVDDLLNSKFYGIIFEDFDKLEWFVQNIKDSNTQQEIKNLLNKEAKGVYSSKNTSNRRYTIIESDGTPLGKVTASSQLDALVKFGIEHPEYADSQSISAKQVDADENAVETTYVSVKELKSFLRQNGAKEVNFGTFVSDIQPSGLVKKMVAHGTKKIRLTYDEYKLDVYSNGARLIENLAVYDGNWKDKYYKFSNPIGVKQVDSKYEETTEQHLDYPNPSETPHDDIVLENHDGWVNTANKK